VYRLLHLQQRHIQHKVPTQQAPTITTPATPSSSSYGKEKCCCRYDLLTDATALLPPSFFLFCPFTPHS